ncbi:DUF3298 and DUF4163 domain-containing protein [Paenibacillus polymyxa]|uniref:DUF3298 and DUF4163 domain-containing protein n=1 Tax=Paenibacillus polymyxa TaxID=1406 RepID=UPI001BEAD9BF|nr:DUF3298 and DUF4163 domain-containing protein [Paenibacillus polymyxa]MBT2284340.1 DUF3298 and DUF4163 domain-containing protein [Paenibacillus polymyxa]
MKKKTITYMKMGAMGCVAMLGVGAASLSANALASAPVSANVTVSSKVHAAVPSATGIKIVEKVLSTTSKNLIVNIKVPQLDGMLDTRYQNELNGILLSRAQKDLAQWEKEAAETAKKAKVNHQKFHPYEFYVSYKLKSDGTGNPAGVVSLEVITEGYRGGTSMPRIDTYNLKNASAAQRVKLEDLLGSNYKEKLDADILTQMRKDPDQYFLEEFKGTLTEQSFYIEKGELVIVFPKYSIAPGYVGSPEFRFNLKNASL